MIINANKGIQVIVELNKSDINRLMNGAEVINSSRHCNDEPILVRVYCSEPTVELCEEDE